MAGSRSITINVEPKVSGSTAKICAAALELYMNQNPEVDLEVKRLNDGTVMVKFTNRLVESIILERHKQDKEARRFDQSK